MWMYNLLLAILGFSGGLSIAGGIFAFIVMIGVIPRMAGRTRTAWCCRSYENASLVGSTLGNIIVVFHLSVPVGYVGLGLFGLGAGVFVGCLAMALAEALNVVPIFSERIGLKQGFPYVILSLAIGKMLGTMLQMLG